ncbi:putative Bro-N domain-containing protein 22 [Diachasmimorpha longicaudata entomopoxvirus]|uniref:Putative Bro-N domain-containing protein 22 n=1 Tax=Diachasmimorpha longicaudata entomopoxvirus TaxID=109981 RepID=A0A7R5WJJ0_9POXV|nr:putative Bro-N domain-containing protein 22 [Diachasmimorpha longicaudata entomopoxvirus]AKS26473.1 putative Bro-N domain-containing protein 22 [Diachasmimorpha longicaudata entomopoxvirus]
MDHILQHLVSTKLHVDSQSLLEYEYKASIMEILYSSKTICVRGSNDMPYYQCDTILKNLGYLKHYSSIETVLDIFLLESDYTPALSEKFDAFGHPNTDNKTYYLTESGLYKIICFAPSIRAARFQRFVFEKLVPSFRKNITFQDQKN